MTTFGSPRWVELQWEIDKDIQAANDAAYGRRLWRAVQHGHRFNAITLHCECGLWHRQYVSRRDQDEPICPKVIAHIEQHGRIPEWLHERLLIEGKNA